MDHTSVGISVVIPVFNGETFLAEALESALGQTHRPAEVIVVDDGSTDASAAIAARHAPRVLCLRRPHAGPAAARNAGVERARSPWIAFLDADDWWEPWALERLAGAALGDPAPDLVSARSRLVWADPEAERVDRLRFGTAVEAVGAIPLMGNLLVRRPVFERLGGFDPGLSRGEDTDWYLRLKEAGIAIRRLDEVVHLYRRHPASLSWTVEARDQQARLLRLLRGSLARRRQTGAGPAHPAPAAAGAASGRPPGGDG